MRSSSETWALALSFILAGCAEKGTEPLALVDAGVPEDAAPGLDLQGPGDLLLRNDATDATLASDAPVAPTPPNMTDFIIALPEDEGMSSAKLEIAKDNLATNKSLAFLVMRNDKIVLEWYRDPDGPTRRYGTASLAKALVGGVSLAVAMTDGRIALDDRAADYIPQWDGQVRKDSVLVRHLGAHSSGVEDAEEGNLAHTALTGWKGDFWKRLPVPSDPFTISRDLAPVLFDPGTRGAYSNPGIALLTYAVTASLVGTQWTDIRSLLRERVMVPLGIPASDWNVGYGETHMVDGLPLVPSWGGANLSTRAVARMGQLMLHAGQWKGMQLIAANAIAATTRDAGTPGSWGQGWWNGNGLPADAFYGLGAGSELLLVVPSRNLIAVRFGADFVSGTRKSLLFDPVLGAITGP
jgi:CubicO group peptidase (beta-lactamase class C family)